MLAATKRHAIALAITLTLASVVAATSALAQGDAPNPSGGTLHSCLQASLSPSASVAGARSAGLPLWVSWRGAMVTELLARRFAVSGPRVVLDGVRLAAIQRRSGVR